MKKNVTTTLILLLVVGCVLGFFASRSLQFSAGRCLLADNGAVMLVTDRSPIVMSKQGGAWMFDGLATGDELLVLHDGINESYPGSTGAYFVVRLGSGSLADISAEVIDSLTELGWLS